MEVAVPDFSQKFSQSFQKTKVFWTEQVGKAVNSTSEATAQAKSSLSETAYQAKEALTQTTNSAVNTVNQATNNALGTVAQYFGQFFNGPVSRGRGSPAIFYAFSETSARLLKP